MARTGMETSAKFRLLVRRIGLAEPYVRGLLETLWDVANATGNPIIGSADAVEASSKWPGKPGEWFNALRDGGWIDEMRDGQWVIHDYWDHAQDYVINRESKRLGITRVEFLKKFRKVQKSARKGNPRIAKSPPPQPSPVQSRQVQDIPTEYPFSPAEPAGESEPEFTCDPPHEVLNHSRKARPADELFNAIAEVGAADPKVHGSRIGRVCKVLRSADPPFTADDVRHLPTAIQARGLSFALTPEAILKHIGWVRAPVPAKRSRPLVERDFRPTGWQGSAKFTETHPMIRLLQPPPEFSAALAFLQEASRDRQPMTDDQIRVYYTLLADIPLETLEVAVQRLAATHEYPTMPTPAAIRRAAFELTAGELSAVEAWGKVWSAVRHYGLENYHQVKPKLPPLVAQVVDNFGWRTLCDSKDAELTKTRWVKDYEQLANAKRRESALPAAWRANALAGDAGAVQVEATTRGALPASVKAIVGGIGRSVEGAA